MKAARLSVTCLGLAILTASLGCTFVPRSQLTACQAHNRALREHRQIDLAEAENLKADKRDLAERLAKAETQLAFLEEELGLDHEELAGHQQQRSQLRSQLLGLGNGRARIPEEVREQLVDLSRQYPDLQFDPITGISKLSTDILFESGQAETKAGADRVLKDLVRVLRSPEAADLKIMVVGHADDRQMAKKPAREKFPNNFYLSTARANAVADLMVREGLAAHRIGVAGFGSHQPIAPNVTPQDRQKNRRVEIFVLNHEVPVVGWTESIPSLY